MARCVGAIRREERTAVGVAALPADGKRTIGDKPIAAIARRGLESSCRRIRFHNGRGVDLRSAAGKWEGLEKQGGTALKRMNRRQWFSAAALLAASGCAAFAKR